MNRTSGILLSISSLPSPYGIGTLGRAAYEYADFLCASGQSVWQMLPLGATGYGDSPYQSVSSYAGNPYFIDLELLIEDGLLTQEEVSSRSWGAEPRLVDYGVLYENRFPVLYRAYRRGWERDGGAVAQFRRENARWLEDYALYMAVKRHFGMRSWQAWEDEELRLRKSPAVLERYRRMLQDEVQYFVYLQFLFYRQWEALRSYVHRLGIRIIGDLPIYVAMDSADVWAEPQFFQLDEAAMPTAVSGVPPDAFSQDGQLWGNPLYDWDAMEKDGFGWWIRRVDGASRLYDSIRIDHFRGLDRYWSVPYGAATAREGTWRQGPGRRLISVLNDWFPTVDFIAEDLGYPAESVVRLLQASGWPGMRVLEFAFDGGKPNSYQPHSYTENCICYTGTHDNSPLRLWWAETDEAVRRYAAAYLGLHAEEGVTWGFLRAGMGSVARLFVAQMQDYLEEPHRMNTPGTPSGNWRWRLLPEELRPELAQRIRELTERYDRLPEAAKV